MTRRGVMLRLRERPAAELRRTCGVLDEAGCDTIYLEQSFTSCAAAAALTRRARVCCLTTSRDAPAVAAAAENLAYLSDGRFILGLGPLPDEDGPYSGVAAAERVIEEVLDRAGKIPILVAGDGRGPAWLAAEFAGSWMTSATSDRLRVVVLRDGTAADHAEVVAPLARSLGSVEEAGAWLGTSFSITGSG
ncbi:MAG TPA: hypothetical protein VGL02_32830, partial [Streptomyces sp.]